MRIPLRLLLTTVVAALLLGATAVSAFAAPANDSFASAEELSGNRGATNYDLSAATNESGEPLDGPSSDITAWFKYTPSADGFASFSTCRPDADLALSGHSINVYTGSALATLSNQTTSTGGCHNDRVNVTTDPIAVTAGVDYWIQLEISATSEILGGQFTYDFNSAEPTNDDIADAAPVTSPLPQTLDADTGLATIEDDEPVDEPTTPRNSIWWEWTADQDGLLAVDTCSSIVGNETDSRVDVFTDGDPDPEVFSPTYFEGNDDGCAPPKTLLSKVFLNVTDGTTYFIRVANYGDDFGAAYKLKLRWVTEPELQIPPRIAPNDPYLLAGQTAYGVATDWMGDPPVDSTEYEWQRCDSSGENCSVIDGEAGTNYLTTEADLGHRLVFKVIGHVGATTVSEESEPSGLIAAVPDNDLFANARDIGSTAPTTVEDRNFLANYESVENNGVTYPVDRSLWYRWTAPESKTYFVDGCQSDETFGFAVNVYDDDGSDLADLESVGVHDEGCDGENGASQAVFPATAGSSYWIQAGSLFGSSAMDFTLSIHEVPGPSFAEAPVLSGTEIEGSNLAVGFQAAASAIVTDSTIGWSLCDSAVSNCVAIDGASDDQLPLTSAMGGKRVKVTVTLTNANGSTSASANSNDIALRPVEPPPEAGPNPTHPVDPFPQPNVAKSLGKVKLKKNSITLSRLKLLCGASATGDCTGTITFTTAKAKKAGKTIKPVKHIVKLRIRPGKTLPQTFKLSSSMLKAIKAAKSLKTSVVIQLGAPGFSTKTVATGVTVSLK